MQVMRDNLNSTSKVLTSATYGPVNDGALLNSHLIPGFCDASGSPALALQALFEPNCCCFISFVLAVGGLLLARACYIL